MLIAVAKITLLTRGWSHLWTCIILQEPQYEDKYFWLKGNQQLINNTSLSICQAMQEFPQLLLNDPPSSILTCN